LKLAGTDWFIVPFVECASVTIDSRKQ